MNAVIYFSGTGESYNIAKYLADKTKFLLLDVTNITANKFTNTILVFPVYCQSAPKCIMEFLSTLKTTRLALVATYGRISYGNVLNEIQNNFNHRIIAAAYVPCKHSYLDEPRFTDFEKLAPITKMSKKLYSATVITIPKAEKHPMASFMPKLRSQIGCKIIKDYALCDKCNICRRRCSLYAIYQGYTNRKCIRCLRCVQNCPNKALTVKLSPSMRKYLAKQPRKDEFILYMN